MKNTVFVCLVVLMNLLAVTARAQSCGNDSIYKIPYKNTYVKSTLAADNEFRTQRPTSIEIPTFEEARKILPVPIWTGHDKEIEMYWKAWEIGVGNIRNPQPGSGFVMPYIDTAYNGNLFMWDSAFILMFARYGERFFPFQNTLDNFYAKQHPDGFICREIMANGADCFERYDPTSTGPNLLPWCEIVYYHQFGDTERLHKIFPALCGYYEWLRLNRTWRNGTYWSSGWGTGMDNMPRVKSEYNPIYSHGHMIWLDTNLQQIFTAGLLLEIGFYTERWQEIETLEDEAQMLKKYVRENLWDEKTGFLYDQYADGSLCTTKGIGAFWALHADVLTDEQLKRLVAELDNPETFKRPFRVPSLAANHPRYKGNGRYWQGGIWPGTNYMVMRGWMDKGFRKQAREIALSHYDQIFQVYKETGTFYEYYAPETAEPGFMACDNFIGWTGLAPIAELIEFIIGIRGDYPTKTIVWDVNLTEANGIERYPFGPEGNISLKAAARRSAIEKPRIEVDSNIPFKLVVRYGDKEETYQVAAGKSNY